MDERKAGVIIPTDLSVVGNCKGNGHMGTWEFIAEYLQDLLVKSVIICKEGLSGRK